MRAANATQSAAETPHPLASIHSPSMSNSLLPNFTFGMEYAEAAVRFTLRPEKLRRRISRIADCYIYFSRFATQAAAAVGDDQIAVHFFR
jgi:hypothetical protein